MKNLLLASILLFLVACGVPPSTEGELPEDLSSLKALLNTKKQEQRTLNQSIEEIETRIAKLDTNIRVSRRLVTTMPVEKKDFKHYVTIQGNVESDDIVYASSETGGRILDLTVDEGHYVKKGALIAKIDLEAINKQIAEVQKSLELAQDVFERQSRLWEQKIGSEMQYLQAKNNKERLEKSLETLDFQLTRGNVYAPIAGAVDMVLLKERELAGPGAPIVQILNTYNLKVVADAPEDLITAIKRGDEVEIYFPALDQKQTARVTLLGRKIDPSNRTFKIEMNLNNRSGIFKPNLLAEIKVNDFTEEDVVVIPIELVQQEVGGKDFVLVSGAEDGEKIAKKLYVETGESDEEEIIIKSGLTIEDELILKGARSTTPNELIEVASTEIPEI